MAGEWSNENSDTACITHTRNTIHYTSVKSGTMGITVTLKTRSQIVQSLQTINTIQYYSFGNIHLYLSRRVAKEGSTERLRGTVELRYVQPRKKKEIEKRG